MNIHIMLKTIAVSCTLLSPSFLLSDHVPSYIQPVLYAYSSSHVFFPQATSKPSCKRKSLSSPSPSTTP